jgi:phosphopantothenoylcysteine decarboxylase / phosphopantothenate---cysteine ligase
MDDLTIDDLDPFVEEQLRLRATRNGRSLEEEVRSILTEALGRVDLDLPPCGPGLEPPASTNDAAVAAGPIVSGFHLLLQASRPIKPA